METIVFPFSSKFLLAKYLLVSALFISAKALIKLSINETIPAVIVFGDSIVDAGNNNDLNTVIRCDFLPYGQDFAGGVPTGRFCNGKVPSDLIAEELGIKDIVPAYLDPKLKPQDLLTGVTFASGGTGYDPLTPKLASVISLGEQLNYFKEYIGKLKAIAGEEKTNFILAKSMFLVVAGSDDIANTYFVLRARQLQYDVPAYTDLMVNSAAEFVKSMFSLAGELSIKTLGLDRLIGLRDIRKRQPYYDKRTYKDGKASRGVEFLYTYKKIDGKKTPKRLLCVRLRTIPVDDMCLDGSSLTKQEFRLVVPSIERTTLLLIGRDANIQKSCKANSS
ncbi:hypothetical protein GOBAR_DD13988 [Gossypium barbadense]|nr:hypothetical protein GOBAR_DD13988 [Gossypium barbadense]